MAVSGTFLSFVVGIDGECHKHPLARIEVAHHHRVDILRVDPAAFSVAPAHIDHCGGCMAAVIGR